MGRVRVGRRLSGLAVGAVVGLATLGVLAACSDPPEPAERRGPQAITSWTLISGPVLRLRVDTCHGDPTADVAETETTVTITVVSTRRNPGDACQDILDVTLETPLAGRTLIDGTTGRSPEGIEG